jgi:hypothetical protein
VPMFVIFTGSSAHTPENLSSRPGAMKLVDRLMLACIHTNSSNDC